MLDPILLAAATTVANGTATALVDWVKGKFNGDKAATDALEAAKGKAKGSPEVAELARTFEAQGPEFVRELTQYNDNSTHVGNLVTGNVAGNVVQTTGDINGGITFN
jgi:hypothetical protein